MRYITVLDIIVATDYFFNSGYLAMDGRTMNMQLFQQYGVEDEQRACGLQQV